MTGAPMSIVPCDTHVSEFIQDELDARGWTLEYLAHQMGGDYGLNLLSLQMLYAVHDPNLLLDKATDDGVARAFGVSEGFFTRLYEAWRREAARLIAAPGCREGGDMTADDVRNKLLWECHHNGGRSAWASANGVSPQCVCDVLMGRREPGKAILRALGLERVVTYRAKEPSP